MSGKDKISMEDLLASEEASFATLIVGDSVEGKVVSITKNGIWLDLGPYGAGLVVGPEIKDKTIVGDLNIGDALSAVVLETEYEDGNALLSLKRASREKAWTRLARLAESKEVISVRPLDANKGGLLIEQEGIRGFLPVSQLSTENYPRVTDKDEIQIRLSGLIGKAMSVVILDADEKENKLIFSEKEAKKTEMSEVINKFAIGDKVKGTVTGIVDFGIFINVDGVEGLVHISEIAWDRVEDPSKFVKIGDEVDALIIGIENDRFSLSLKRLKEDPWAETAKQFKVGDKIEGEVTRITPFGAFVRIHDNIEALVHISELSEGHIKDPNEVVETAKRYTFIILSIDKENHKIALSLKAVVKKGAKETTPEPDDKSDKKEVVKEKKAEKTENSGDSPVSKPVKTVTKPAKNAVEKKTVAKGK
jgi:small subunit ribosomal protein S1